MSDLEQGTLAGEPVPTSDERTMATLAHVLQLVGWFIAPLIIFFVKRESRFVSFHALQAVFLQLVYLLAWCCFTVLWFVFIFGTVFTGPKSGPPPPLFFIMISLLWVVAMGIWVLLLATAVIYGIKAGKGEWAEYPVIGGWARKVLADQQPAPPAAG